MYSKQNKKSTEYFFSKILFLQIRFLDNRTLRLYCLCRGHTVLYAIVSIIFLLTFIGRPEFIFQSHLHIPWLTNVQHVQRLECISDIDHPGWPRTKQSFEKSSLDGYLTVVLVTARPDFKRLPLTLASLACHLDYRLLNEVILLVPHQHATFLKPFISNQVSHHWPWPISIISDNKLLKHKHTHSYRLQMMFKLVLAQVIKTEYYMILDSDCVAIWPIHVEQLLWQQTKSNLQIDHSTPSHVALYQLEERSDHAEWWPESEKLLRIKPNTCLKSNPSAKAMGVTPAILSKTISLRTLCRLQKNYGKLLLHFIFYVNIIVINR